ncbi:hypothetical protein OAD50_05250, partial [Vicingaceae bacterium]|nr:hypothetical protein [Vicingaceae bacterium]
MKVFIFIICFVTALTTSSQTVLFSEDFESTPISMTDNSTGSASWSIASTFQNGGLNSDSARVVQGDTLILESNAFSTMGFTFVNLYF